MASRAQNYAVGIGGGAAAGAATGASIGGPWGALIGGVIGGGAGAVGAAVKSNDEDAQKRKLAEMQARQRKLAAIMLLRNQAASHGTDTQDIDAWLDREGMDYEQNLQNKQLAAAQRLDPNAFVGMAQNLARTGQGIYNAANAPKSTGIPTIQDGAYSLNPQRFSLNGDYHAGNAPTLQEEPTDYPLDPTRFRLNGGFR